MILWIFVLRMLGLATTLCSINQDVSQLAEAHLTSMGCSGEGPPLQVFRKEELKVQLGLWVAGMMKRKICAASASVMGPQN